MNIDAFYKISYGLYIIGSEMDGKINGHISNTVFQVSADPITVAICSNKSNLTTDYILNSGKISISVLTEEADLKFIGRFGFKSGRDINKYEGIQHILTPNGLPAVTEKTCAYFEGKVISSVDVKTHMMFIAEITGAEMIETTFNPLTYKYYRDVIKGLSPKSAPTYIKH